MELVEYGCDWLRGTTSDKAKYKEMESLFEAAWLDEWARGARRKDRSMLGYDGSGWEHGFLGARDDGWMFQLSGRIANEYLKQYLRIGLNITRIDLQCTFRFSEAEPQHAARILAEIEANRLAHSQDYSKAGLCYIDGRGKGCTLQIGSRSSEKYGRIYDKEKESGEDIYQSCWRYEIEFKGEVAKHYAKVLMVNSSKENICGIISGTMGKWGVDVTKWGDFELALYQYERNKYDTDRVLSWLSKQVAPSIAKLLQNGTGLVEIMLVLGLDNYKDL